MEKSGFSYVVIEDDSEVCEKIRQRMTKYMDWNCLGTFPFYEEALRNVIDNRPDLLFLDFSIRGGNSFDLLDEIKCIDSYDPYIIFFTAYLSDKPEIAEGALNTYKVNKYLNKPIFEKLTLFLDEYICEAKTWTLKHIPLTTWIETIDKLKVKLIPQEIICISQSRSTPRNKIIHTLAGDYEIRANWNVCEEIVRKYRLSYFFANTRDTLINRKFITKIQRPNIWLNGSLKVTVTKENWKQVNVPQLED